jgi:TPR repeat protein
VSYRKGIGVAKNPVEAVRWYKAAANLGHPQAQGTLGVMYINGESVDSNYEEAARWFLMAAKQNDVQAQYFLGNMYIRGDGVPQDKRRAYFWLRIAQAQGADQALPTLAQLESELSKEELADLKKELLDLGIGNSR